MKTTPLISIALAISLNVLTAHAQPGMHGRGMGGPPPAPNMAGSMKQVFGEHTDFSANVLMQQKGESDADTMAMPGKMAVSKGKSRFEMDMTEMKGGKMPPGSAAQMKQMGMGSMVSISRPDKKMSYIIYPDLHAYTESPLTDANATKSDADFKTEITEIGKDTVDGHPSVKNKVVVTDKAGKKDEFTVWNATDLRKFPVKIETLEQGKTSVMLFKDVKFSTPEASLFEPPADFKRYESMATMMQEEIMKRMGGGRIPQGQ